MIMNNIDLTKYEKALYYEIFINKEYQILNSIINTSSVIFDIWSNIWFFSLYCQQINSNCKIHMFEPVSDSFEKSKLILQNYFSNIYFNNVAIWISEWVQLLYVNESKPMQSSIFNNTFLNPDWYIVESKIITLNKYLLDNNISKIDLVKMDIEWAEFDILLNLEDFIFNSIESIYLEFHLFNNMLELKYKQLLERLQKIYKNVQILPNKYSDKLWYILCTNNANN